MEGRKTTLILSSLMLMVWAASAAPTIVPDDISVTTEEDGTVEGLCGGKPADILFLLDASSSIWGPNFDKQLKFVHNVIHKFDVSPGMTHVAAFTFSNYVHEEFGLNSFSDRMNTLGAIPNVKQLRGGTRTDLALTQALQMMTSDGRKDVPRLVIVMTDGKSDMPEETMKVAESLRNAGVTIFSLGIGLSVDQNELKGIASQEEYVFSVNTFDALITLQSILAYEACRVEVVMQNDEGEDNNSIYGDGFELEKGCDGKPADVVFALDASGSIWEPDFQRQLAFVQDMVSVFDVSPNVTQIGVLTFGDIPHKAFHLNKYENEQDVTAAIGQIPQTRGDTNTADAIHAMRRHFFSPEHARDTVVKIAVVITDGLSKDPVATAHQAQLARDDGIHLFSIGVGQAVDMQELLNIASKPAHEYMFAVNDYSALTSIKKLLAMKTCEVTMPPTTPPPTTTLPPGCGAQRPADLVFAMPSAADRKEAQKVLQMMAGVIENAEVGPDAVRVGLVPKDCFTVPGFQLKHTVDKEQIMAKIDGRYAAATRDTAQILKYMRKNTFSSENGARKEASRIAVIILDNSSANKEDSALESLKAKEELGATIIVVKVGEDVPDDEALLIASSENNIISVSSYDDLPSLAAQIAEKMDEICNLS